MKRRLNVQQKACRLAAAVTLMTPVLAAAPVPAWADYAIIVDCNVFDPNRAPQRKREGRPAAEREPTVSDPQPAHIDLLGVLVYDNRCLAFLRSTEPQWQGVAELRVGTTVGPGILEGVTTEKLTVRIGEERVVWPVGVRLKQNDHSWELHQRLPARPGSTPAPRQPSSPRESASGSSRAEILKRLMERRRSQLRP